jgi:hypothetical protein
MSLIEKLNSFENSKASSKKVSEQTVSPERKRINQSIATLKQKFNRQKNVK